MNAADFVHLPGGSLFVIVLYLTIGTGLGHVYFQTMWRSVRVFAGETPGKRMLLAMTLRVAILGLVLLLTSLHGAAPLLATALGFTAGRHLVLRRVRGLSA